jgi:hypothetical protein
MWRRRSRMPSWRESGRERPWSSAEGRPSAAAPAGCGASCRTCSPHTTGRLATAGESSPPSSSASSTRSGTTRRSGGTRGPRAGHPRGSRRFAAGSSPTPRWRRDLGPCRPSPRSAIWAISSAFRSASSSGWRMPRSGADRARGAPPQLPLPLAPAPERPAAADRAAQGAAQGGAASDPPRDPRPRPARRRGPRIPARPVGPQPRGVAHRSARGAALRPRGLLRLRPGRVHLRDLARGRLPGRRRPRPHGALHQRRPARGVGASAAARGPGADVRPRSPRSPAATPHLPQGAPTSPALANLAAFRLDRRLAGLAASLGAGLHPLWACPRRPPPSGGFELIAPRCPRSRQ